MRVISERRERLLGPTLELLLLFASRRSSTGLWGSGVAAFAAAISWKWTICTATSRALRLGTGSGGNSAGGGVDTCELRAFDVDGIADRWAAR